MPVIDYVRSFEISSDEGINELTTLSCLAAGLSTLANQVASIERPIQEFERTNRQRVSFFGFGFDLPPGAEQLLPCYFHWFGMSVCNYARLVGFLGGLGSGAFDRSVMEDTAKYPLVKTYCDNYVSSIAEIAAVQLWRNKIFAHFAITDPHRTDNAALLDLSVMSPISYFDNRFRVGGVHIASRGAVSSLPPWSVTDVFESLKSRFWRGNA